MPERIVCVAGLGYVGLPLLLEFGKKGRVIGDDIGKKRVEDLSKGYDHNGEVEKSEIEKSDVLFSSDPSVLSKSNFKEWRSETHTRFLNLGIFIVQN